MVLLTALAAKEMNLCPLKFGLPTKMETEEWIFRSLASKARPETEREFIKLLSYLKLKFFFLAEA